MPLLPLDVGVDGGRSDVLLGFGCASLGDVPGRRDKCKVIEAAYEAGFRHFDVAPSYGQGEAEGVLAEVLSGVRARVSIVTKAGIAHPKASGVMRHVRRLAAPLKSMVPGIWGAASHRASRLNAPSGRFSPAQLDASVAESLRRLNCNSVDALLLHEARQADISSEVMQTLEAFVANGHAGAIGTGTTVEETHRILERWPGRFRVLQANHYWASRSPALLVEGGRLVTHRCIRSGLDLLADPLFVQLVAAHRCGPELQMVFASGRKAGDLLLASALQTCPGAMILVSTSRPERTAQLVGVACRAATDPLAFALNQCLDAMAQVLLSTDAANIASALREAGVEQEERDRQNREPHVL